VELRLGRQALSERDRSRLEEGFFLNDSVMNFFIQLLTRYIMVSDRSREVHIFSTQFFTQLTGRGVASGQEGWMNVRTWTKRVPDVLGHRCLLVPINEATPSGCHWWVAAVELPAAAGATEGPKIGRLFQLDSLPSEEPEREEFRSKVIRFLRGYLQKEDEQRRSGGSTAASTSSAVGPPLRRLPFEVSDAPEQENGCDCGVFVLELCAELLRRGGECGELRGSGAGPKAWFGQQRASARRRVMREVAALLVEEAELQGCSDVATLLGEPSAVSPGSTATASASAEPSSSTALLARVRSLWAEAEAETEASEAMEATPPETQ